MMTKYDEIPSKKEYYCDVCNKTVKGNSYKFKSHLFQHRVIKPRFKCSHCGKEFYRIDAYKRHLTIHNGGKKYHICDYCDRSFVDKRNLISHLQIHDDTFFRRNLKYQCMACNIGYCEERLLKYHIRREHFNFEEKDPTHVKKKLNETWIERVNQTEVLVQMTKVNDNVITIKKCGAIVKDRDIKFHVEKQIKNETDVPKKMTARIVKEKNEKFSDYISSVFARKDKSQYSKAVCNYCGKEMLKKSLKIHIRERHLKLRRFKCDCCKETFSRHYQMINHTCFSFKRRERLDGKIITEIA